MGKWACLPQIQHIPAIVKFLGYDPYSIEMIETFGAKIMRYRHQKGLSQKKLGNLLNVNGSTIKSWENDEFLPSQKSEKSKPIN